VFAVFQNGQKTLKSHCGYEEDPKNILSHKPDFFLVRHPKSSFLHKKSKSKISKGDLPPPFFWALLRVMGASGGPLVLLQVKKGAFITARELSHKKLKELFHKKIILRERGLSLLILAKLSCAFSAASLVLGMPIIANVSFATLDF
jgi:hypothetical protein